MTYPHTPYYCEENIYHLCADPSVPGSPRAVLVISNPSRTVAVAHQRAATSSDTPVVWDYHVVLATLAPLAADRPLPAWSIYDLDTTLGLPVPLHPYLRASFAYPDGFPPPLTARFRVVPAQQYRETLCTDRRHMLDEDGDYRAPPPSWPSIGTGSNLERFIDMDDESFVGQVVELAELPAALDRLRPTP